MSAKVSNDFSTHTRKDSCPSNSCGSACLCCVSANRHSMLSRERSQTRPRIVLHSCAWQKPSRHFLAACIAAETLSVIERQKIVRLLVKDILVGEDTITIRHSIPIPSSPPQNEGLGSSDGRNYLLCKGRDHPALRGALITRHQLTVLLFHWRFQPASRYREPSIALAHVS